MELEIYPLVEKKGNTGSLRKRHSSFPNRHTRNRCLTSKVDASLDAPMTTNTRHALGPLLLWMSKSIFFLILSPIIQTLSWTEAPESDNIVYIRSV